MFIFVQYCDLIAIVIWINFDVALFAINSISQFISNYMVCCIKLQNQNAVFLLNSSVNNFLMKAPLIIVFKFHLIIFAHTLMNQTIFSHLFRNGNVTCLQFFTNIFKYVKTYHFLSSPNYQINNFLRLLLSLAMIKAVINSVWLIFICILFESPSPNLQYLENAL